MNNKKLRMEFHDADIESVFESNGNLVIQFSSIPILEIIDDFGFKFEETFYKKGKIEIINPQFKTLPTEGDVFDGHIRNGEARYGLVPLSIIYKSPCMLFLQQQSGDHFIYGDEIKIEVEV